MSQEQVANIYARALLQLAEEQGTLSAVEEEFSAVLTVFQKDPDIWAFFLSPLVNLEEKERVVRKAVQGAVSETLSNFLGVLVRKNRFSHLPEIFEQFHLSLDILKNRGYLKIVSQEPLIAANKEKIVGIITKKFGKELRVQEVVDPQLIGGFKLYLDDYLIDASMRHKLETIEDNLLHKKIPSGAMYEN